MGYAPEISATQAASLGVSDTVLRVMKRRLYHRYLEVMMTELTDMAKKSDLLLYLNGDVRRVWPVVSYFANDHPEGQLICLVYDSAKANRPCRFCLTLQANLHVWDLHGDPRIMSETKKRVEDLCKEVDDRVEQRWRRGGASDRGGDVDEHISARTIADIENDSSDLSVHLDPVSPLSEQGLL